MQTSSLPRDPKQLQLMFQVARQVLAKDAPADLELTSASKAAVELLDVDHGAAHQLALAVTAWKDNPRVEADKFIGELSTQMGLTKAGLLNEQAALNRIANLGTSIGKAGVGLPADVVLPPGELSATWDGQHPRLASTFPKIVIGHSTKTGEIGLENLLDTLPDQIGKPPHSVSKADLRARVTPLIEQGIDPREHLQPGGIVATELVAMLAGIKKGDKVVDLCAGELGTAIHLNKNYGAEVMTYEVSDAATAVGREKVRNADAQIDIRAQSISRIDIANDSVDAIVSNNGDGVHYVKEREAMFGSFHDGLKPGQFTVQNGYIPGTKPDSMSAAAWEELKLGFTEFMGLEGKDINSEAYAQQLESAGFGAENIEIIDIGDLYHVWHEAVADKMKATGAEDPWLQDWIQRSDASDHHMGAIIRAQKTESA